MHSYLKEILTHKQHEVTALKEDEHIVNMLNESMTPTHEFKQAVSQPGLNVIAEVKRKSPSKGELADIQDPVALAGDYAKGGAAAISVLTDSFGFSGSIDDLAQVAKNVECPVLRKDFIIDPLQIAEAALHGAKAVLLIVAVLGDETARYIKTCHQLGLDALVEVHDEAELDLAIRAGADIIGINNRNLNTFEVDVHTSLTLRPLIPNSVVSVAESGIRDLDTADLYSKAGFNAVLIGEALVKSESPAQFIEAIRGLK